MNKEKMNKYAYELMVKNNPREAVQRLMLLDKLQEENFDLKSKLLEKKCSDKDVEYQEKMKLQQRIDKAIECINKALKPDSDYIEYEFGVELLRDELLNILKGE